MRVPFAHEEREDDFLRLHTCDKRPCLEIVQHLFDFTLFSKVGYPPNTSADYCGFFERLLGRFGHVGRLLAAAVSAAVVQSFLPGGPAIKTTDFSWDGGNVVGFLRSKHGEDR